jgi:D-alanyl-D-alanine dipeptidase
MNALLLLMSSFAAAPIEPLVDVSELIPDAIVDLRYATADNFMRKQVYPSDARCLLERSAAGHLAQAAAALRAKNFRLRLYDCYRPQQMQWALWKILPKPGFVADPRTGSRHSRGTAVDLTLAHGDGGVVEMPTEYDNFTRAAYHSYEGGSASSRANRNLLRQAMADAGFRRIKMEWWHYEWPGTGRHPLRDEPFTRRDDVDGGR